MGIENEKVVGLVVRERMGSFCPNFDECGMTIVNNYCFLLELEERGNSC